mgnify:FL=1
MPMNTDHPQTSAESVTSHDASDAAGPFDVRTIRYLIRLMRRHDITEIDLRDGTRRVRLRRGGPVSAGGAASVPAPATPAPALPTESPQSSAAAPAKQLIEIKSPTPGTFYAAPSPDAEPFVRVGSKVQPDTVVCLIEAMKVFNEITADCTGTIVAVMVENQQPVEYGQVLFKVDPTV